MNCYLLTVCQGSSLDRYTNNFSLFSILEEFAPSSFPAQLGVSTVAFFSVSSAEQNLDYEVRLAVTANQYEAFTSAPLAFTPTASRHRIRMNGLVIPEAGDYQVHVDWRPKDGPAWNRDSASWPLRANGPLQ